MTKPAKLAVVGAGLIGKRHIKVISSSRKVELSAIVDPCKSAATEAAKYNTSYHSSLTELFAETKPDGVILATPTTLHIKQAFECVANNTPVLVEKPLGVTVAEALPLVDYAAEKKVPVLVGHHRQYNPLIQEAKKTIEQGKLGVIRSFHAMCWMYKPDEYFEIAPWRTKKGAGPISVNLVHDVNLIHYLCGKIESVQAMGRLSIRGYENPDLAVAIFKFAGGALGTISVSDSIVAPWSWELTAHENPAYCPMNENCYFIGGSKASLSIPDLRLWSHKDKPNWNLPMRAESLMRNYSDPLVNQIDHFASVIRGEKKPLVSADVGLTTLRVLEAIENSISQNREVVIEY